MEFYDVANTQRAMRRLKTDPVPDELIWKILDTAIKAPSGGNRQPWNFLVITDGDKKRKIGEWYLDAWNKMYGPAKDAMLANPDMARTFRSADHLANHLADVPVLIIATIKKDMPNVSSTLGASIYPAVQNLMLAARAEGLGTTLTTLHKLHEAEVKQLLGIPEDTETMALIPIGWPKGKFGAASRMPIEKIVYWEQWGDRREKQATAP
jgi:nitroreductase